MTLRIKYEVLLILGFLLFSFKVFSQVHHWENIIAAEQDWRYFPGNVPPPLDWKDLSFDDSTWEEGPGSIGYGDNDDQTIIDKVASLYMRREFVLIDTSQIEALLLNADYDDGFIVYLNGVEIARANVNAINPAFDYSAEIPREAKLYGNGIAAAFVIEEEVYKAHLKNGTNVLAVHTLNYLGLVSSDLTTKYWLNAGINSSDTIYNPIPAWFDFMAFESPIAIMRINTWAEPIYDEPSIQGEMEVIWNDQGLPNQSYGPANELKAHITIEKRGQFSLYEFPKNGYAIETKDSLWNDMDVSMLGLPPEEDWVLHGPYADKSLIRNVLAMKMARDVGQYASRTRYLELIVNGQFEGLYILMEKIKRGPDRVDIAKLNPEEIVGDDLTGGYIFKCDKGPVDWYSDFNMVFNPGNKLRFQYVYPQRSTIVSEQESYIQGIVDDFEYSMLNTNAPVNGKYYYEYIDLNSFAEHFLIMEFTKNIDAYRISEYYYKDKDSKGGLIKSGPVWDFNFAFGLNDYCNAWTSHGWVHYEHCGIFNPFWWGTLIEEPNFANKVNCKWFELIEGPWAIENLHTFIDSQALLLQPVLGRNFTRWPILDQPVIAVKYVPGTYQGEIDLIKDWLVARMDWINENIIGTCMTYTDDPESAQDLVLFPNPTKDILYFNTDLEFRSVDLLDLNGQLIKRYNADSFSAHSILLPTLPPGLYLVRFSNSGESITKKISIL